MTPIPESCTRADPTPADSAPADPPGVDPPGVEPAAATTRRPVAGQSGGSPTVRRRVLASELKNLRRAAGLTHVDIANRLGWQQGKVSKIESAKQGVGIEAVIALSEVCKASFAHRERLVELARTARTKGWWEAYGDVLAPEQRTYVGLEADADVVSVFGVESVPELLRTRDYAEALLNASSNGARQEDRVARAIEVLLARQRNLFERPDFRFDVVLSESALRRVVGGTEVVRGQCARLVELAERPDVVLRVLPFAVGALPVDSPFSILEFRHDPHPEVVFVPGRATCAYFEDVVEVGAYRDAMTSLRSRALDPDESAAFIQYVDRQLSSAGAGWAEGAVVPSREGR